MEKHFVFHEHTLPETVGEGTVRRILAYTDQLMVCQIHFSRGATSSAHVHPHDQITYVVKGVLEFTVGGKTAVVQAGDTVCMEGGVEHAVTAVLEDAVIVDSFTPKRADFLGK